MQTEVAPKVAQVEAQAVSTAEAVDTVALHQAAAAASTAEAVMVVGLQVE